MHKMRSGSNILKFLYVICSLQILLTVYLILKVYFSNVLRPDQVQNNDGKDNYDNVENYNSQSFVLEEGSRMDDGEFGNGIERELLKAGKEFISTKHLKTVEIWGKAAIASYLWEHILEGTKFVDPQNPTIYSATKTTPKFHLNYKEGPGLQFENISLNMSHLVLVLNGRTQEKVAESKEWVKRVANSVSRPKVALVMLGNEECENDWIQEFMHPKGPVHGVFITYDDPVIDEQVILQWPLGVATYRHFPLLMQNDANPSQPRKFICNLQATNYPNSSRTTLFSSLQTSSIAKKHCFIKERKEWAASESPESSREYLNLLLQSDITLCPAGFNTETYRVYEALAAGSVPVVEDTPSKGSCDQKSGWRLLKMFNPPVIWIGTWAKLPNILEREMKMTSGEKIRRRKKLMNWYEWFKLRNRDRFLSLLHKLL